MAQSDKEQVFEEMLEALKYALPAIKACAEEYPDGEWPKMYEKSKSAVQRGEQFL